MSGKLLLSLVDCIRQKSEANPEEGRELFMRMLEVVVLKFKTIAKIQMPILIQKCEQQNQQQQGGSGQSPTATPTEVKAEPEVKKDPTETLENALAGTQGGQKEEKTKFGSPPNNNYNVADYRSLLKTLICIVKTINSFTPCKVGFPFLIIE